jgi:5-dehydro-2-deoxygluconokinase
MPTHVDAYVVGRLSADLYPLQINTPLEEVRTFERFVGGFAGNVATGLARLGWPWPSCRLSAIMATAVSCDVFSATRGSTSAGWAHTQLFGRRWPSARRGRRTNFPLTFYREPTCPDWELRLQDIPIDELADAPLVYVTGTGLART